MKVVKVDYRFSDIWEVTDFINPRLDVSFTGEGDKLVEEVGAFIRDQFSYPLIRGNPSADGQLKRYHKSSFQYHFEKCVFYMWNFPQETLAQKLGICIDTANLATSLLIPDIDAWCCLGEVRAIDSTLLGLHAWAGFPYKGEPTIMETTIHNPANTLVSVRDAYDKSSAWALNGGLYYVEQARYNDKQFRGDSSVVAVMGLPTKRVWLFGLKKARLLSAKKLYREWAREERWKVKLLEEAYR